MWRVSVLRTIFIAMRNHPYFYYCIGTVLILFSLIARIASYPVVTSDYTYFLAKWFVLLQETPGLTAFATPFSDYAPLYLYVLKILSFIPVSSLYSIKTISLLFDGVIAIVVARLMQKSSYAYTQGQRFFGGAVVFSLPTLILNSSLWGQSDSLYASFVIISMYMMLAANPIASALAFGIALSLKIQAIFFLPVFVGFCLRRSQTYSYLLIPPLIYIVSIIPAFLGGGDVWQLLTIYAHQAGEYPWLNMSSPSVYAFSDGVSLSATLQSALFWLGIGSAGLIALAIAGEVAGLRAHLQSGFVGLRSQLSAQSLIMLSFLSVLIVPYVLPRMHERYFYLADLLSVIYALYTPRRAYVAVMVVGASLLAYMPYLSQQVAWLSPFRVSLVFPALVLMVVLGILLYDVLSRGSNTRRGLESNVDMKSRRGMSS